MKYMDQMVEDITEYVKNNVNLADYEDRDDLEESLNDDLWAEDSITGNGSGSYTFNREQAKEYVLADGVDYYREAVSEFGMSADDVAKDFLESDWEGIDVTIRCYLLGQAISEALDRMEANGELEFDTEGDE